MKKLFLICVLLLIPTGLLAQDRNYHPIFKHAKSIEIKAVEGTTVQNFVIKIKSGETYVGKIENGKILEVREQEKK
jgi:hypothetical protein